MKRKYLGCRFLPRQFQCGIFPGWTWWLVGFSGIVSFSPPSSGNGLKYRAAKLFTAYIRSTLLFLFFSWVHCKRQVQFLSPCLVGQFHFHKFPQRSMYFMRWNRSAITGFLQANKSSADCGNICTLCKSMVCQIFQYCCLLTCCFHVFDFIAVIYRCFFIAILSFFQR